MTAPVEEDVQETRAPLDEADEDVVYTAKEMEYGDIEDMPTPSEEEVLEEKAERAEEPEEPEEEPEEPEEEPEEPVAEEAPEEEVEPEAEIGPSTHTVKINGEAYELSTDDLIAGYQQAAASQQKFQRAAEVEKAARSVIDNVLDPDKSVDTMIDLYADQMEGDRDKAAEKVDEIIGKRIQHLIDLEEMSDDERKVHELEAEKARMNEHLMQQQAAQQQQQRVDFMNYQNTQAVPLLDRSIAAYNLEVGSAEDKESSQILAEYIKQGYEITQEVADQTVAGVVQRRADLLQTTLSGMTAEELSVTNPDLAKQVQQRKAEEIQASRATTTGANQGSTSKRRRKAKTDGEYKDSNDFFNTTDF